MPALQNSLEAKVFEGQAPPQPYAPKRAGIVFLFGAPGAGKFESYSSERANGCFAGVNLWIEQLEIVFKGKLGPLAVPTSTGETNQYSVKELLNDFGDEYGDEMWARTVDLGGYTSTAMTPTQKGAALAARAHLWGEYWHDRWYEQQALLNSIPKSNPDPRCQMMNCDVPPPYGLPILRYDFGSRATFWNHMMLDKMALRLPPEGAKGTQAHPRVLFKGCQHTFLEDRLPDDAFVQTLNWRTAYNLPQFPSVKLHGTGFYTKIVSAVFGASKDGKKLFRPHALSLKEFSMTAAVTSVKISYFDCKTTFEVLDQEERMTLAEKFDTVRTFMANAVAGTGSDSFENIFGGSAHALGPDTNVHNFPLGLKIPAMTKNRDRHSVYICSDGKGACTNIDRSSAERWYLMYWTKSRLSNGGLGLDNDVVLMFQNHNMKCLTTFRGSKTSEEYAANMDNWPAKWCGVVAMRGYAREARKLTSTDNKGAGALMPSSAIMQSEFGHNDPTPLMSRWSFCTELTFSGYSQGAGVASLVAACLNSPPDIVVAAEPNLDYQSLTLGLNASQTAEYQQTVRSEICNYFENDFLGQTADMAADAAMSAPTPAPAPTPRPPPPPGFAPPSGGGGGKGPPSGGGGGGGGSGRR